MDILNAVPNPDQSRPDTSQGRCLGTSSAGVLLDPKVGSQRRSVLTNKHIVKHIVEEGEAKKMQQKRMRSVLSPLKWVDIELMKWAVTHQFRAASDKLLCSGAQASVC